MPSFLTSNNSISVAGSAASFKEPISLPIRFLRCHSSSRNDWDVNAAAVSFRHEEEDADGNKVPLDEAHYQSRHASTVGGSRLLSSAGPRTKVSNDRDEPVPPSHAS